MHCPTLPVVLGRSLPLLIYLVACGALAATDNEPSGPIIDWNLQKMSPSIGRSHSELQPTTSAPLRFDPQPPHALRFSESQEVL
ncbi:MAG: hypothetical protein VX431_05680, partial [Planctomycetota bacterium]|nr:hypothetical protein [Planctomycetota bacterium]